MKHWLNQGDVDYRLMRNVKVVPHNPTWQRQFDSEAKQITEALGENVIAIHHIGSTAIPGIYAKPTLM